MEGLDKLIELCKLTERETDKICGRAIYPGGGIMYQSALRATQGLRVDPVGFRKGGPRWGPTKEQKEGLIESLGVAPIRKKRWGMNVKIGYDGYNNVKTGKWAATGQPNIMIARVIESGTSFMQPQYFMTRAVQNSTPSIETAVKRQFEEELVEIWGKK